MSLALLRSRFDQRGSVAVETALVLPVLLLLTVGGLSVIWWLHNKAMMHLVVSEVARDRANDATFVGYYNDFKAAVEPLPQSEALGLPNMRFVSFHLPVEPPFVVAAACSSPGGSVPAVPAISPPESPQRRGEGWLSEVQDVRFFLEDGLSEIERLESLADGWADKGVRVGEQLVFYRRLLESLSSEQEHLQRQAIDYLVGALVEKGMEFPCRQDAQGGIVLTAKAVIQGERAYPQK